VSEVIESYIRRNPGLSEKDAFEGFLREERIRAWVGADESRKERLRKEFGRVWGSMHGDGQLARASRAGPSGPASLEQPRTVRVNIQAEPEQAAKQVPPSLAPPSADARKLSVMCTVCGRIDVWMQADHIGCRSCGRAYEDMLQLIRVTPVGPFAFLFGEGWVGYATAGGIVGAFTLLYFLLRGL